MTAALVILGAAVAGLITIYMTPPALSRQRISAAEFLEDMPPPQTRTRRFSLSAPVRAWSFFVRLLIVGLIMASCWLHLDRLEAAAANLVAVSLAVDVSDSMRTTVAGEIYLDRARRIAAEVLDHLGTAQFASCVNVGVFDNRWRWLASNVGPGEAAALLAQLAARPRGTDLRLPSQTLDPPADAEGGHCKPDNVVVLSDQPVTALTLPDGVAMVWVDVSTSVSNAAIVDVQQHRDPITGDTQRVTVVLQKWGDPAARSLLIDAGDSEAALPIEWADDDRVTVEFAPAEAGEHLLRLDATDAYDGDDRAVVDVERRERLEVDWPTGQAELRRFGWVHREGSDLLRVRSFAERVSGDPVSGAVPTIWLGPGLGSEPWQIGAFDEGHAVLDDVNFDFLSSVGLPVVPATFTDLASVVSDQDGRRRLAARDGEVFLPASPGVGGDDASRLTLTLFLNAARWLIGNAGSRPFRFERPDGTFVADAFNEGQVLATASSGDYRLLKPKPQSDGSDPLWPWIVMLALLLFVLDRCLTAAVPGRYE